MLPLRVRAWDVLSIGSAHVHPMLNAERIV